MLSKSPYGILDLIRYQVKLRQIVGYKGIQLCEEYKQLIGGPIKLLRGVQLQDFSYVFAPYSGGYYIINFLDVIYILGILYSLYLAYSFNEVAESIYLSAYSGDLGSQLFVFFIVGAIRVVYIFVLVNQDRYGGHRQVVGRWGLLIVIYGSSLSSYCV